MKCKVCGGDCGLVHKADMANNASNTTDMANKSMANSTYKYRDADSRKSYMREYMRKRRQGVVGDGGSSSSLLAIYLLEL